MATMTETDYDDILCHCTATSKTQLLNLIHAGADSLKKISHLTGATAGCGGCADSVEALLAAAQAPTTTSA